MFADKEQYESVGFIGLGVFLLHILTITSPEELLVITVFSHSANASILARAKDESLLFSFILKFTLNAAVAAIARSNAPPKIFFFRI